MISVQQALESVRKNCKCNSESFTIKLKDAQGFVLFSNVKSPINMPPFRQSAMDGYALNIHDDLNYKLIGEIKAGDNTNPLLKPGEALRIFTGAPVPDSANAVMMQEKTTIKNEVLHLTESIKTNTNIRPLGEQVYKGDIALKKGTKLNSASIAYLTSLGITEIQVYKKPTVGIVVTGNELAQAGEPLQYGQIYESNAIMLESALKKSGYNNTNIHQVVDNYNETLNTLKNALNSNDVLLISGGISVGDYDFVGRALKELGVREHFYKVKQKPGKPLFFGQNEEKYVFALPGNPAAALTCFYIYVLTALEQLNGNSDFSLHKIKAKSLSNFIKKGNRAQFLKAVYKNDTVEILEGQNSSMLHTFATANALVFLDEDMLQILKDDKLETILLPTH